MFTVHSSNRTERLLDQVLQLLETQPLRQPLRAEQILIQSPGMATWLKLRIARAHSPMREVEALYDYLLGLFNNRRLGLRPRDVAVSRLPEHDTVFAMTIHKSQGSEFDHAILVLPEQDSELLTKELLYTGVTRARHHCTLFAPEAVLRATIGRRTRRASGLRDLLWRDDRGQGCFEDTLNS